MVDIRPFKATILNPGMSVEKLICPVYDTIDEFKFKEFAREKDNVIHVTTRKKDMDRDEFIGHARNNLNRLKNSGVLVKRKEPAFYIYGIKYTLPGEILAQIPEKDRRSNYFVLGLVTLVKVEKLGQGNIVGHENIFEINTTERYRLMKNCLMNFSPITAEYNMPGHELNNLFEEYLGFKRPGFVRDPDRPPLVDVNLDGSRHLLWEITDKDIISRITGMISEQKILILDGHHRYTASSMMLEKDGIEYTMMMLMEGGDRALLLLPWHRAVRNFDRVELENKIAEQFTIQWQGESISDEFYANLREWESAHDVRIGMFNGKKYTILRADNNAVRELSQDRSETIGLDLMVLHEWIINPVIRGKPVEDVYFNASPKEAISRVDKGEFDVAFLMNTLSVKDVEKKAFNEMKNFPQKSTLFLPKVAEGIIMREID